MGRPWSKWSVFEYMRHRFMNTGNVPDRKELFIEFLGMESSEIDEGAKEFELAMKIGGGLRAQ